jgi:hypothetical protein
MPTKQRFTSRGNQQSHTDTVVQSSTIEKNTHCLTIYVCPQTFYQYKAK